MVRDRRSREINRLTALANDDLHQVGVARVGLGRERGGDGRHVVAAGFQVLDEAVHNLGLDLWLVALHVHDQLIPQPPRPPASPLTHPSPRPPPPPAGVRSVPLWWGGVFTPPRVKKGRRPPTIRSSS